MASNSAPQAKFSVGLDDQISGSAKSAADAMEQLRARIEGGDTAIKEMSGALRRLRGSTDEIKAAKERLKAQIAAERDAVSAANLQLVKAGTNYDKLANAQKKIKADQLKEAEARTKAMGNAVQAAGGPLQMLRDKLGTLGSVAGGEGAGGLGLATLAVAGLTAAIVAAVAALGAGVVALTRFIVTSANMLRSMDLAREAWSGTAANAANLGTQIDALAAKVPTAKAKLNDLAISLMKAKLGGQATVDSFNAVAQASAALGDEAGGKLQGFIERGKLFDRFRLDPREMLYGFGNLSFDDVAKHLAKGMHTSVEAARAALMQGQVTLGAGAKALREAVEEKFGSLNLRKMLDLNVMAEKFREKLDQLTSGVNLEPLLRGFSKLASLFDENTVTGAALKQMITVFGNTFGKTFEALVPYASQFMKGMIITALDLAIAFFKVKNSLSKAFGSDTMQGIDWMRVALDAGKYAVMAIVVGIGALAAAVALAVAPFVALGLAISELQSWSERLGTSIREFFVGTDWSSLGTSIVNGLIKGLKDGASALRSAVGGLADSVKNAFKDALGIHSPSKVFAEFGQFSAKGYAQGVEDGAPEANAAAASMIALPSGAGGAVSGALGAPVSVTVQIHVDANGAKDPEAVAQAVSAPNILDEITEAVLRGLATQGVPA